MRAVCPHWLRDRTDDIVQNAVIRVLRLLEQSEGKRELAPSYLWKVAYTAMIDEVRRVHPERYESLEGAVADGAPPSHASKALDPESETSGRELGAAIQSCLQTLVRPRRLAVALYLYGHGVPEAARLMGWDAKRTENLVYRGLNDMRKCLSAKGLEP